MALTSLALTAATKQFSSALILASLTDSARTPVGDIVERQGEHESDYSCGGLVHFFAPLIHPEIPQMTPELA